MVERPVRIERIHEDAYRRAELGLLEPGVDAAGVAWYYVGGYNLQAEERRIGEWGHVYVSQVPTQVVPSRERREARREACERCGHHQPVAACEFDTNLVGGGPQRRYRGVFVFCEACRELTILAEGVLTAAGWRPLPFGRRPVLPILPVREP